jgi:hypothetical protein
MLLLLNLWWQKALTETTASNFDEAYYKNESIIIFYNPPLQDLQHSNPVYAAESTPTILLAKLQTTAALQ